jgi:ribosomal protein S18 acetylase RimI-like enzyme
LAPQHVPACAAILRALPDWFGMEEAREQYVVDLPGLEAYVAVQAEAVLGFIALRPHSPYAVEIHVMAVAPAFHRRGVGRALVAHAEGLLRARGVEYLSVKTLGPSRPDAHYAATRAFYAALGFRLLEETTAFWGEENPTLVMIRRL